MTDIDIRAVSWIYLSNVEAFEVKCRSIMPVNNTFFLKLWRVWTQESFHKWGEYDLWVNVDLNRTVVSVVDSDWRFDNLCSSHLQSLIFFYSKYMEDRAEVRNLLVIKTVCTLVGQWFAEYTVCHFSFRAYLAVWLWLVVTLFFKVSLKDSIVSFSPRPLL